MKDFLYKLFIGHRHEWETISARALYMENFYGRKQNVGVRYDMRCKHCGKITHYDSY